MRVAFINTFNNGSTGRIALEVLDEVKKNGGDTALYYGRCLNDGPGVYTGISNIKNKLIDVLVALTGDNGHFHWKETKNIIHELDKFKPDIIHFHNLHGNYVNLVKILEYTAKNHIKAVFTVHDFYLFTGRCAYPFECPNWLHGCGNCKYKHRYPKTLFFDKSKKLLEEKIRLLKEINPVIVCPSKWIMNEIKKSQLSFCKCELINNGIEMQNDYEPKVRISNNKIILLGIASPWDERKGLNVFNELAKRLDPNKYEIRLVGLEDSNETNSNIVRFKKMNKSDVLKRIEECDVFINPSIADNFPTTNLEVISMGKPIIAYDISGTAEVVNKINGIKVPPYNVDALYNAILNFNVADYNPKAIMEDAKKYSLQEMKNKYYQLFVSLMGGSHIK